MNIRERTPAVILTVLLTVWILTASLIYLRQFAGPALRYLARAMGHG